MTRSFIAALVALGMLNGVARAEALYGVTNLQTLVTFDSDTRVVTSTVGLSGFSITGELLLSIDVRPATGELYGLSNQNNIYKINPITGARTQIGSTIVPAPTGGLKAIDFNPTVDRIRVLGSSGDTTNLRVHPDTGVLAAEDGDLAFAVGDANAGDTPAVVNGAYTNSVRGRNDDDALRLRRVQRCARDAKSTEQRHAQHGRSNRLQPGDLGRVHRV